MPTATTDMSWTPEEEALVLKVFHHPDKFDKDHDLTPIGKHLEAAIAQLPLECFLTCKDTKDVAHNGERLHVIEPQAYDEITVLDKKHEMLQHSSRNPNGDCAGHFDHGDLLDHGGKKAVSGSGDDVWYKMGPALVACCKKIHAEIAALSADNPKLAGLKRSLAQYEAEAADLDKQATELQRITFALDKAAQNKQEQVLWLRREMGKALLAADVERE